MTHSHQHTNLHDHVPYHKLTEAQGRAWCLPAHVGDNVRRSMASQLAKMYPTAGCGVCSPTMKLVAYVSPQGALRLLTAPFKVIPISAIANKPSTSDCPCQQFYDPEVRGPFRSRADASSRHHPFCQYEKDASRVFAEVYQAKNGGVVLDDKGRAKRERSRSRARPDLMHQVQRRVKGG